MHQTTPPAAVRWPHRDRLLARQRELQLRSAELRGALSAELQGVWREVEPPLDLGLRVLALVRDARRGLAQLRDEHPWLMGGVLPVALPFLRWTWRRWWRSRRGGGELEGRRASGPGRIARVLRLLRWVQRGVRLWAMVGNCRHPHL